MDKMNQSNCIFTANNSSSLDMVVQDHALHDHYGHHHQLPFDSLFMDNHPLHSHQGLSPSSPYRIPAAGSVVHCEKAKNPVLENEGGIQEDGGEEEEEQLSAMKEMLYKIAVMQPVDIDPATIRKPKRRNVRISDDPQSVAARHRRERISEKIRILQRLVPGGTKMDTASMLEEASRYIKFLKRQIRQLEGIKHQQQPCIIGSIGDGLAARQWDIPVSSNTGSAVDPPPTVAQDYSFRGSITSGSILNFNPEVIGDN